MKLLNDGKFQLASVRIFKKRITVDLWLTRDCSNSLRDKALLKVIIWNNRKLPVKEFRYELIQLRSKS